MAPRAPSLWLAVLLVVVASSGRAQDAGVVRLEVQFEAGTELVCPDREIIENAVAARLGYEPFDDTSPRRLVARVTREGGSLVGEVRLSEPDGSLVGVRRIEDAGRDCNELARALELAIAIAIDPRAILRPPPPLLPDEEGQPPTPRERGQPMPVDTTPPPEGLVSVRPVEVVRVWNTDEPLVEGPPPPIDYPARLLALGALRERERLAGERAEGAGEATAAADDDGAGASAGDDGLRALVGTRASDAPVKLTLGVGGLASFATAPSPTLGNTLSLGLAFRSVGFGLEFQRNLPAAGSLSPDQEDMVWADLRMLTASVCGAYDWIFACGGASLGAQLFGTAKNDVLIVSGVSFWLPEQPRPYLGLQGRIGVDVPVLWFLDGWRDHVRLRLHGDVNAAAFSWHIRRPPSELTGKPGETLWVMPPLGFTAGMQLVVGWP